MMRFFSRMFVSCVSRAAIPKRISLSSKILCKKRFRASLSKCFPKLISKCSTGYEVHSVSSRSMASPSNSSLRPSK